MVHAYLCICISIQHCVYKDLKPERTKIFVGLSHKRWQLWRNFVKKLLKKRCIKCTCTVVLMLARRRQLWKIRKNNFGKLERISFSERGGGGRERATRCRISWDLILKRNCDLCGFLQIQQAVLWNFSVFLKGEAHKTGKRIKDFHVQIRVGY